MCVLGSFRKKLYMGGGGYIIFQWLTPRHWDFWPPGQRFLPPDIHHRPPVKGNFDDFCQPNLYGVILSWLWTWIKSIHDSFDIFLSSFSSVTVWFPYLRYTCVKCLFIFHDGKILNAVCSKKDSLHTLELYFCGPVESVVLVLNLV